MSEQTAYAGNGVLRNPIKGGFDTEHYAAMIVLGALLLCYLLRSGFRPRINAGGVSASIS